MFLKKARLRDQKWFAQITALSLSLTAGAFGTVGTEAAAQTIVAYVVQSDRGGWIGQRSKEIRSLRASRQAVEFDLPPETSLVLM